MSTPTLQERMVALREREKVADPSTRSPETTQSSLSVFLILYSRTTNGAYYEDYMKGAKYLLRWLTPIGWNPSIQGCPLDLQVEKYPRILDESFKADRVLSSYDACELAKIITSSYMDRSKDFTEYMRQEAKIRRAICLTMIDLITKEVL